MARQGQRPAWMPLLGLVLSSTVAVIAAEGLARLMLAPTRYWFPQGMYVADPVVKFRLAPNYQAEVRTPFFRYHVRTSSLGYRGADVEAQPQKPLVALFGDSFAFGQGVDEEDSFAGILASRLAALQRRFINTGVYGYATTQEYQTYVRLDAQIPISTVVLQVCWNDVLDQSAPVQRGVFDGYLNANPPTSRWGRVKNQLLLHSEFVSQLNLLRYKLRALRDAAPDFLTPGYEIQKAREIRSTEGVLERWVADAALRNQRFVIVYTPSELQVNPGRPDIKRWRAQHLDLDLDAGHRWLVQFVARHPQVVYVDAVELFRRHYREGGSSLYISGDEHTNVDGNRLIAEALLPQVLGSEPPATR